MGTAVSLSFGAAMLLGLGPWLVDLAPAAHAVFGVLLLWHAARPNRLTVLAPVALACVALRDGVRFYGAEIDAGVMVPFSFVVAALLLVAVCRRGRFAVPIALVLAFLFPVSQAYFFGKTSYARAADTAVVFGARCYADGTPSQALHDRVATACRLWHEGHVRRLLMSGGPGDGPVHETEAMRALAVRLGVPDAAIDLDKDGVNTRATVRNTGGPGRLLAVSHFYHLPRIKQAYRSAGREVWTVPADESYTIRAMPWFVAREVAAFWWYALKDAI